MADVSIAYKSSVIAEINEEGTKTLKTAGCYCSDDIKVSYVPRPSGETNCKVYEITLAKSSGWVLLTTLDEEVLEHINDANLVVNLKLASEYVYTYYAGNTFVVGNSAIGYNSGYDVYGMSNRTNKETTTSVNVVYYPANKTDTSTSLGGTCMFRIDGNKYYMRPGDGYVYPGTYRLTFTW